MTWGKGAAVEGGAPGEKLVQIEHAPGWDGLVELDLPGWDLAPFTDAQDWVGVWAPFSDLSEDHLQKSG